MKVIYRSFLLISIVLILASIPLVPARADDRTPPADAADIISLRRITDLSGGAGNTSPSYMTVYGNKLYFSADSSLGIGTELWYLDITLSIVPGNPNYIDVCPGVGDSSPSSLAVYNGALYFSANGCNGAGTELWRYDPINGPTLVDDIVLGGNSSFPLHLAVSGGLLYFSADGANGLGTELWSYNSSLPVSLSNPAVHNLCPGAASSNPGYLADYGGVLYLAADTCDGSGYELYAYDPINGAQLAADIYPGGLSSNPAYLEVYDGSLYFAAGQDGTGRELWSYNLIDGAQLMADINSGEFGSSPTHLAVYNGALYFGATSSDQAGHELWKYDPANGADRALDIYPGSGSSYPAFMAAYNGALYFQAISDDGMGYELWQYDNTTTARFRPAKSLEGWVLESSETSSTGGTLNALQPSFNLGDDGLNRQYRSILSFNTSNLPDNAVVVSATLKIRRLALVGTDPFTSHGNILIDIIKGAFSGNIALQASDFQAAPGKSGAGSILNLSDLNNWFTGALTKAAFPYLNKTGLTQLRLRFTKDDNNDSDADFLLFYSADSTSMADFPVLEVKYYIP